MKLKQLLASSRNTIFRPNLIKGVTSVTYKYFILFLCGLFNDAMGSSDYIASNKIINE